MSERIKTKNERFSLRFANEGDIKLILSFIKELAEYENLLHEVVATEEMLLDSLFRCKAAEVIIGEYDKEPVGFVLFFYNFSTFLGRPGIYIYKGLGAIPMDEWTVYRVCDKTLENLANCEYTFSKRED